MLLYSWEGTDHLYARIRAPLPFCSALTQELGELAQGGEPVPQYLLGADATDSTALEVHPWYLCPTAKGAPCLMV